ncbi:HEAT repeat domain-containing protein [Brevibacillus fortis]|uniref:HEAT repeat domain-containing protein n=1 Tax=Brevibacillus fortis TaxID=2126352 RepID=UPI0038FD16B0
MIEVTYLKGLFLNRREDLQLRLGDIGDLLEYGTHNLNEVITFTEYALELAITEENFGVKESLFYLIMNAVTFQGIARNVEWDRLANVLPTLDDAILVYALTILGCSKNRKFIKVIEPYLHSPNDDIRQTAAEALVEINYNVEE